MTTNTKPDTLAAEALAEISAGLLMNQRPHADKPHTLIADPPRGTRVDVAVSVSGTTLQVTATEDRQAHRPGQYVTDLTMLADDPDRGAWLRWFAQLVNAIAMRGITPASPVAHRREDGAAVAVPDLHGAGPCYSAALWERDGERILELNRRAEERRAQERAQLAERERKLATGELVVALERNGSGWRNVTLPRAECVEAANPLRHITGRPRCWRRRADVDQEAVDERARQQQKDRQMAAGTARYDAGRQREREEREAAEQAKRAEQNEAVARRVVEILQEKGLALPEGADLTKLAGAVDPDQSEG